MVRAHRGGSGREKKIEGIAALARTNPTATASAWSSSSGARAMPEVVLNQLYRFTALQYLVRRAQSWRSTAAVLW